MPAIVGAIPLIMKYGIPLATFGIGHLIGFLRGKKKGMTAGQLAQQLEK
jgi:hypothetical protein